jgi:hypothetical protein
MQERRSTAGAVWYPGRQHGDLPVWRQLKRHHKAIFGVLGTLLALWIVPLLTRQVQDRATVRDLKVDLAGEMSSSTAQLDSIGVLRAYDLLQRSEAGSLEFSTGGSVESGDAREIVDRKTLNAGFGEWLDDSSSIAAKLQAYFPDNPELRNLWLAFSSSLVAFYFVAESPRNLEVTSSRVSDLQASIAGLNALAGTAFKDADKLLTLTNDEITDLKKGQNRRDDITTFFIAYNAVSLKFLNAKDTVIERVLHAHVQGFSTKPCDFFSTAVTLEPGRLCFLD